MFNGLSAGVLWAMDTVILGIAFSMSPFVSKEAAVLLAPFVSTFLHDACSSLWMLLYMGAKRQLGSVGKAANTKSGRFIMLGALLGGPVGMSGYVAAIKLIGPAYTSVISALYPALGALFACVFLKEKMSRLQVCGLAVSILCVIGIGISAGGEFTGERGTADFIAGVMCALICAVGWALEAVICSYGMKRGGVTDEQALQIRQITSAVAYGAVILPIISGWTMTAEAVASGVIGVAALSALFGTASYVMYYRAITKIGVSKAMTLNITYTAWAVVFTAIMSRELPGIKNVILGVLLILGSLTAANCLLRRKIK